MLSLIVEVTEQCNSNCCYCLRTKSVAVMREETLSRLYERVAEHLRRHEDTVEIEWHGGEPLLVGAPFYEGALRLQRRLGDTCGRLRYGLQTNLTRLTPAFLPALRGMGIRSVGTSFDPEPGVRGFGPTIDADRYKRAFLKGLALLESAGIDHAVNYVVTKKSLRSPADLFTLLTNLCPSGNIAFNPVRVVGDRAEDLRIAASEYVDFLDAVFRCWWPRRAQLPSMQPFAALCARLQQKDPSEERGQPPFRQLWISTAGVLHQCARADDAGETSHGTLCDTSFADALSSIHDARRRKLEHNALPEGCSRCRFLEECHSGGVPDAFSQNQRVFEKGAWCDGRWEFIARHFERTDDGPYGVIDE
jgi:uncharacterized protein